MVQIRTRLEIAAAQAEEESDVSTLDTAFHFSFVKFGEMKTDGETKQTKQIKTNLGLQLKYSFGLLLYTSCYMKMSAL